MRMKLVKQSVSEKPNAYYGKTYYEYTFLTEEQRAQITNNYKRALEKIEILKRENPLKYQKMQVPRLVVPKPLITDYDDCIKKHYNEEVLGTIKKNNGNIQVFVSTPTIKESPPEQKQINEETVTIVEDFTCKDCGKAFASELAVKSHKRFCKGVKNAG